MNTYIKILEKSIDENVCEDKIAERIEIFESSENKNIFSKYQFTLCSSLMAN